MGDSFYLNHNRVICNDCHVYKSSYADSIINQDADFAHQDALNESARSYGECSDSTNSIWHQILLQNSTESPQTSLAVACATFPANQESEVSDRATGDVNDEENLHELRLEGDEARLSGAQTTNHDAQLDIT